MVAKALSATANVHWNTPPQVLDPLREFLPISLDPCSNPSSIVGADVSIALPLDGLVVPWHRYAHTFCNPPYDVQLPWLLKAASERVLFEACAITLLIPAAVETFAFRQIVFGYADAVAFWKRRVGFMRPDGKPVSGNSHPSALAYFGDEPERFAECMRRHATVATRWVS